MEYHVRPNALVDYAESFSKIICDQFFETQERVSGRDLVRFTNVPQVNAFLVKTVFEGWQEEAANIKSPLFDYSSPAVKEQLGSLMKTLSSNISIDRAHMEPMIVQATVDTFILTFNPKQYFRILFGKLPSVISPERDLKPRLKYTKLHPDFIEKTFLSINKAGHEIKLKAANDIMDRIAEDVELFSDPELIAKQFQGAKAFNISDLVSDWIEEVPAIRGIMSPALGDGDEAENVPEIDASFEEKNKHYEDEDYIPEEEEIAIYNEEDLNSEEVFIGNEERVLSTADLNGTTVPHDEQPLVSAPSLDDESTHNLIEEQPSLVLDEETARSIREPNVEKAEVPDFDTDHDTFDTEEEETKEDEVPETFVATSTNTEEENVVEEETTTLEDTPSDEHSPHFVSSYPPLKGTIPLNLKFKFQNELFNGDNAEFNSAIEMIDQCKDYHTAIALIKEKYIKPFDWDLGAEATRDFLSLVDKKFE